MRSKVIPVFGSADSRQPSNVTSVGTSWLKPSYVDTLSLWMGPGATCMGTLDPEVHLIVFPCRTASGD